MRKSFYAGAAALMLVSTLSVGCSNDAKTRAEAAEAKAARAEDRANAAMAAVERLERKVNDLSDKIDAMFAKRLRK